jgi:hypothetical protein
MTPARLDMPVVPGATNRKPLWLMQPDYTYKPIAAINQAAPLTLTVPAHGLPGDWPVWIEGSNSSALNRSPAREPFRMARVIDTDTIEFNDINGAAIRASGGQLVYQTPVDLTGCTGRLLITGSDSSTLELTTADGGLVIEGPGQILIVITASQSAELTFDRGTYDLDLTMSNGDVIRWLEGDVTTRSERCHAC